MLRRRLSWLTRVAGGSRRRSHDGLGRPGRQPMRCRRSRLAKWRRRTGDRWLRDGCHMLVIWRRELAERCRHRGCVEAQRTCVPRRRSRACRASAGRADGGRARARQVAGRGSGRAGGQARGHGSHRRGGRHRGQPGRLAGGPGAPGCRAAGAVDDRLNRSEWEEVCMLGGQNEPFVRAWGARSADTQGRWTDGITPGCDFGGTRMLRGSRRHVASGATITRLGAIGY